ncbi:MAG: peptidoglycan DD-metalloendopeptidase family protein [Endomicrobiaceae bacterium]|nr:peptidoglycan DD-metalloendopeptidase family protein [Endomicrobiaceae bacterium]
MFKFINVFFIIFFISIIPHSLNADVKSDLKLKNTELNQIRQDINKKKSEKSRLQKQEKKFKKELARITLAIGSTEKQLKKIEKEIIIAEKKLAVASEQYTSADQEKNLVNTRIQQQYLEYTKQKLISYYCYPLEFKMREKLIQDDFNKYSDAKNRGNIAQKDVEKYNKAKKHLINLKNKQQNLVSKNKKLQREKNLLLKTTEDKRIEAERDIQALSESAKALAKLIEKLAVVSKKVEIATSKKKQTSIRSASNTRKHNLPWPVTGTVVLNYGKNKHPELDTNIISNGIKIKTQNNAIIQSVDTGRVAFVGEFRSYGKMIIIDHKGEFFSVYAQLSEILVKEEQSVSRGSAIAKVGKGDSAVLYFEIRQSNIPENPRLWLKEK